jgi:hypothetical protein
VFNADLELHSANESVNREYRWVVAFSSGRHIVCSSCSDLDLAFANNSTGRFASLATLRP